MGLGLHDTFTPIAITDIVCVVFGSGMTVSRLYIRRSRLWWDDTFAFLSILFMFIQMIFYFVHYVNPDILSHHWKVATYYVLPAFFYCIIWSARISILFSMVRIEPNPYRQKRIFVAIAGFALTFIALMAQLFVTCERDTRWKSMKAPQCSLGKAVAITQLVTDVIADTILLVTPLRLFLAIQERATRRRLGLIFSTCVATTIVSIVHAVFLIKSQGTKVLISAIVETGVSMMVASLPVVVTSLLRFTPINPNAGATSGTKRTRATTLRFAHSTRTGIAWDRDTRDEGLTALDDENVLSPTVTRGEWTPRRTDTDNSSLDAGLPPQRHSDVNAI